MHESIDAHFCFRLLNMATDLYIIGGGGGNAFDFTGRDNGATLKKIGVAEEGNKIKAVRAELSDGRVETFGNAHTFKEYTFKLGERITKLCVCVCVCVCMRGHVYVIATSTPQF